MYVVYDRVWTAQECVCCACDPSVPISIPSIVFFSCLPMSEVISF